MKRRSSSAIGRARGVPRAAILAQLASSSALAGELADEVLEILGLAEIAIDRGEADIGDVVEALQPLHHQLADLLGRDLALAGALELAHDAVDHALDPLGLDRALAQRDLDRAHQLVAVERHRAGRSLDHGQLAQLHPLEGREAAAAVRADAAAADRGAVLGRPRVLHLGVGDCRKRDSAWSASACLRIGRSGSGRSTPSTLLLAPPPRQRRRAFRRLGDRVEHLGDQPADLAGTRLTPKPRVVPAGVPRRMPEVTNGFSGSNGMPFLLQVMSARPSAFSARLPVSALRPQVDQHQVVVGAAGDDVEAGAPAALAASALALSTTFLRIGLELRPQRLAEGHRLGGDDMHQRAALQAREDRRVDLLGDVLVVGEDHAAARAAQRLVRGRGDDMGMRERRGMRAAGDQAGEMRHVDHQIGADLVGDLAEAREVPDARIGGAAGDDQLRLVLARRAAATSSIVDAAGRRGARRRGRP